MPGLFAFHQGFSRVETLFYERFIAAGTLKASRDLLAEVSAHAPRDGSALDVGCGGGQALVELAAARPDLRLAGVDASTSMIDRAAGRRQREANLDFTVASALDLPYGDESFDVVFSLFSLKHWPDQEAGLAECVRVLRRTGRLLVADIDASADRRRWRAFVAHTGLPRAVANAYATATFKPILRRSIRPERLRQQIEQLPVSDARVSQHPELAIVWATAIVVR